MEFHTEERVVHSWARKVWLWKEKAFKQTKLSSLLKIKKAVNVIKWKINLEISSTKDDIDEIDKKQDLLRTRRTTAKDSKGSLNPGESKTENDINSFTKITTECSHTYSSNATLNKKESNSSSGYVTISDENRTFRANDTSGNQSIQNGSVETQTERLATFSGDTKNTHLCEEPQLEGPSNVYSTCQIEKDQNPQPLDSQSQAETGRKCSLGGMETLTYRSVKSNDAEPTKSCSSNISIAEFKEKVTTDNADQFSHENKLSRTLSDSENHERTINEETINGSHLVNRAKTDTKLSISHASDARTLTETEQSAICSGDTENTQLYEEPPNESRSNLYAMCQNEKGQNPQPLDSNAQAETERKCSLDGMETFTYQSINDNNVEPTKSCSSNTSIAEFKEKVTTDNADQYSHENKLSRTLSDSANHERTTHDKTINDNHLISGEKTDKELNIIHTSEVGTLTEIEKLATRSGDTKHTQLCGEPHIEGRLNLYPISKNKGHPTPLPLDSNAQAETERKCSLDGMEKITVNGNDAEPTKSCSSSKMYVAGCRDKETTANKRTILNADQYNYGTGAKLNIRQTSDSETLADTEGAKEEKANLANINSELATHERTEEIHVLTNSRTGTNEQKLNKTCINKQFPGSFAEGEGCISRPVDKTNGQDLRDSELVQKCQSENKMLSISPNLQVPSATASMCYDCNYVYSSQSDVSVTAADHCLFGTLGMLAIGIRFIQHYSLYFVQTLMLMHKVTHLNEVPGKRASVVSLTRQLHYRSENEMCLNDIDIIDIRHGTSLFALHRQLRNGYNDRDRGFDYSFGNLVDFFMFCSAEIQGSMNLNIMDGIFYGEQSNPAELYLILDFKSEKDNISDHFLLHKYYEQMKLQEQLNTKPKYRLIVVTAEVFENAMRQYQIENYQVTLSNFFPTNCRLFIGIPVYKDGLINRRDNKDRR